MGGSSVRVCSNSSIFFFQFSRCDFAYVSPEQEQEEYIREGIDWRSVDFRDNQECLDLIEVM